MVSATSMIALMVTAVVKWKVRRMSNNSVDVF